VSVLPPYQWILHLLLPNLPKQMELFCKHGRLPSCPDAQL
jgi:hypothetical protein